MSDRLTKLVLFSSVQFCFTYTETILSTIRDGEPRVATWTFTQLLMFVQCRFTSTETMRTIRDGEPRTSTSSFTQLLSLFVSVLLYVHRNQQAY